MKIALICDWLTGMRGGERCFEVVCELYPDADIFTLVHFPGSVSKTIELHKIHTSYIQRLPGNAKKFRRYLPLFGHAMQKFDFTNYDLVLSFSHCVAKSIKVPAGLLHVCYCHTPMRYAWHMRNQYLNKFKGLKKFAAEMMLNHLRKWDRKTSSMVTHFIANSKNVQNRIKQAYDRDSEVIYPPVDCDRFTISDTDDGYYLIVSALVPYKKVDLAVQVFNKLKQELLVVGDGPELEHLKAMASANVSFVESTSDKEIVQYMERCRALIFPGEEDFGIVPLEAQACGKPVVAYGKGGALETVIGLDQTPISETKATGIFFYEQSPEALQKTVLRFKELRDQFDPNECHNNALKFDRPKYKQSMQNYIQSAVAETCHKC